MNKKGKMHSIRVTLLVIIAIALVIMAASLTTFSAVVLRNTHVTDSKQELSLTAQEEGAKIEKKMDNAMDVARTLAASLKSMKKGNSDLSRSEVNYMLEQVLSENPDFLGVYTAWEPNAFDGMDGDYANTKGHDETGRFIPYWSRDESDDISLSALTGFEDEGSYYQVPKSMKKEAIIEPYSYEINGKEVLMTSLVVPIIIDDKFVGIAGIDIALDYLQEAADKVDLYNGTASFSIFSHEGIVAASKGTPDILGQSIKDLSTDVSDILSGIQKGEVFTSESDGEILAFAPLTVGHTTTPWSVLISVPSSETTREANRTVLQLVILALVILVISLILPVVEITKITSGLSLIATSAHKLAQGDITVDVNEAVVEKIRNRKDELAEISISFGALRQYLTLSSNDADAIANGDLTIDVQPKSEKDKLGIALKKMLQAMHAMITQIIDSAGALGASSEQLASAANQAGQATTQIAATIQQVASGTTQQSQSAAITASSVEQVSRAIDGVAQGAQEQASAVAKASSITSQINESLSIFTKNIERTSSDSDAAATSAKEGTKSVEETLMGMEVIKGKVGVSAEKVQDMGTRSEQIGMIVETIEDIASQTNLLALNAAIEAARAGENGKGFAVVADEVRKLAERSASATREIGNLVRGIQKTVAEAVSAMDESSREVEVGVQRANQSGAVLQNILELVETVNKQSKQAAEAAEKMSMAANELVTSMDSVSAVVEENTAATEEMAASSNEVGKAIENIASVSEENSAAVEEVSASAEEMSAQVEEVTASAQSLAEMAEKLNEIVSIFKI
jgi:methyl-accepting chemotaxis protein